MAHSRAAAAGELASAAGSVSSTYIAEGTVFTDAEYDTYFDGQGFGQPGNILVGVSENGASVVVDIDP